MNLLYENIKRIKNLMDIEESEEVDSMDVFKGEIDQDPIQVQGPDGMDESDLSEQEDGGGETSTSSSSYPAIEKWASGAAVGPGNPRGNEKWTWKGTTGKANPKDDKKKWTSGRTFGPTGKYLGVA
jgi:hypothetical protein